jgi:hypothetical protein
MPAAHHQAARMHELLRRDCAPPAPTHPDPPTPNLQVLNCMIGGGVAALVYGRDDQPSCEQVTGGDPALPQLAACSCAIKAKTSRHPPLPSQPRSAPLPRRCVPHALAGITLTGACNDPPSYIPTAGLARMQGELLRCAGRQGGVSCFRLPARKSACHTQHPSPGTCMPAGTRPLLGST